jgi:hypothetical protein
MMTYDLPRIVSVQKENGVNAYVVLEFDAYREFIMKIMFEDQIDEENYLEENPDVRKAVKDGLIPSGNYHFKGMGNVEGRKFRPAQMAAAPTDPSPQATAAPAGHSPRTTAAPADGPAQLAASFPGREAPTGRFPIGGAPRR